MIVFVMKNEIISKNEIFDLHTNIFIFVDIMLI